MKTYMLLLTVILLLLFMGGSSLVFAGEPDFFEKVIIEENPDIFPVVRHCYEG